MEYIILLIFSFFNRSGYLMAVRRQPFLPLLIAVKMRLTLLSVLYVLLFFAFPAWANHG